VKVPGFGNSWLLLNLVRCPNDADTLAKDFDAQDILALNLTVRVEEGVWRRRKAEK
jgi:hypothetical protein